MHQPDDPGVIGTPVPPRTEYANLLPILLIAIVALAIIAAAVQHLTGINLGFKF